MIVVGAGHAGLEAAFACEKQGLNVALITLNKDSIGLMPCNPSIGGPAKGIVTREIDCLGGIQARATDECQIQMKLLNTSKGPGVWALRAQVDKVKYHQWFVNALKKSNINLIIGEVTNLIIKNKKVVGVELNHQASLLSSYVILTTGTYLKAKTYRGHDSKQEGPDNSLPANFLSNHLAKLGFKITRLKTGTPPRIKSNTIDYSTFKIEPGSDMKICFSHFGKKYLPFKKQVPCYIVHTNDKTHKIIKDNLKRSAMYSGLIKGVGPRYCPSIEDKIVRFENKLRHQIFVEPESLSLDTKYLGGFSTSMPVDVQEKMIRSLPGFKNCEIVKYAYAIEYDAIDPTQLKKTLESKLIKNLYFAGQINGTSGYEEAAAQGIIAAINVCNDFKKKPPLILKRNESYIGVMIDDITTKGILDPYRLLTSRAEHRLNLRNDNAQERILKYGYECGMISKVNYQQYLDEQKKIEEIINLLKTKTVGKYKSLAKKEIKTNQTLFDFLKRPEVNIKDILKQINYDYQKLDDDLLMKINIRVKFDGYIKKQNEEIAKVNNLEKYSLNKIKDYKQIEHLSLEAIDKLNRIMPLDLDQASRISGINMTDIITIKLYLDKKISS